MYFDLGFWPVETRSGHAQLMHSLYEIEYYLSALRFCTEKKAVGARTQDGFPLSLEAKHKRELYIAKKLQTLQA